MGAAVALFRNPLALRAIEQHANYIIRAGSRDLGKHTLKVHAPVWHCWYIRVCGSWRAKAMNCLLIRELKKQNVLLHIKAQPDFELIREPELNLLCYRYIPTDMRRELQTSPHKFRKQKLINELNIQLQKAQRAAGRSFVFAHEIAAAMLRHG